MNDDVNIGNACQIDNNNICMNEEITFDKIKFTMKEFIMKKLIYLLQDYPCFKLVYYHDEETNEKYPVLFIKTILHIIIVEIDIEQHGELRKNMSYNAMINTYEKSITLIKLNINSIEHDGESMNILINDQLSILHKLVLRQIYMIKTIVEYKLITINYTNDDNIYKIISEYDITEKINIIKKN